MSNHQQLMYIGKFSRDIPLITAMSTQTMQSGTGRSHASCFNEVARVTFGVCVRVFVWPAVFSSTWDGHGSALVVVLVVLVTSSSLRWVVMFQLACVCLWLYKIPITFWSGSESRAAQTWPAIHLHFSNFRSKEFPQFIVNTSSRHGKPHHF